MSDSNANATPNSQRTGDWIAIFGDTFIGLDAAGTIQQIIGPLELPTSLSTGSPPAPTWHDVIAQIADPNARDGLRHLWDAIAGERVAPDHWPDSVPFTASTLAHLQRIENSAPIAYAVHIRPTALCNLDALLSTHMPDALQYLIQLSQGVNRGVHGPLTDPQVNIVGNIVTLSQTIDNLFNDLRTEISAPTILAPAPHPVQSLFAFETAAFPSVRRINTHRLGLQIDLPEDVQVYCYHTVRGSIRQILETLFRDITPQTTISITAPDDAPAGTFQVVIAYNSREPGLSSPEPLRPLGLADAARFKPTTALQRLVTTAHSHVRPVNGQVWAEPVSDNADHTMRIGITLPRWQTPQTQATP